MESSTIASQPWPLGAVATMRLRRKELRIVNGRAAWIEQQPSDRTNPVRHCSDDGITTVTPQGFSCGASLHTYGTGSFVQSAGGSLICIDQTTGSLVVIDDDGRTRNLDISPHGGLGDLTRGPGDSIMFVRALDGHPHREQVCLVELSNAASLVVLFETPGFLSTPALQPRGAKLAVTTWPEHGNALDDALVLIVDLEDRDAPVVRVAGGAAATSQATWLDDDHVALIATSEDRAQVGCADLGGNVVFGPAIDGECQDEHFWSGRTSLVAHVDHTVLVAARRAGLDTLFRVDLRTNDARQIDGPWMRIDGIASNGDVIFVLGSTASGRALIWSIDDENSVTRIVGDEHDGPVARAACFYAPGNGGKVPGHFFAPTGARLREGLPPLICIAHSGPLASADPSFDPVIQAFSSRGFAVALIDYRGSTGYGERWRHGLDDAWGIVDVEDCRAGARYLADLGLVDPTAMIIRGSSAGGYTALLSLWGDTPFIAACAISAVTDLTSLAAVSPPIERGSLARLVGPRSPSPLDIAADLNGSILLMSGSLDQVVPLSQAETLAHELEARHRDVTMVVLDGEGHSIRSAENIVAALAAELDFYERVIGTVVGGSDL